MKNIRPNYRISPPGRLTSIRARLRLLPLVLLVLLLGFQEADAQERYKYITSRPDITGDQFLAGSSVVDAVAYSNVLLRRRLAFDMDARWFPARFMIRPTDKYGITLPGPSGKGYEYGSMMRYRIGGGYHGERVSGFLAMDYYVASHVESFTGLWSPFAGFMAAFGGGKSTGFGALAGQFMPGMEYRHSEHLKFRLAWIFSFRDEIDESGLFISKFTKNNFVGRYQHGDYGSWFDSDNIPEGVSGLRQNMPYLGVWYRDVELTGLYSGGAMAFLQLARIIETDRPILREFVPALSYADRAFQVFDDRNITRFSQELTLQLGNYIVRPKTDLGIAPFRLYQGRVSVTRGWILGGISYIDLLNPGGEREQLVGFRGGVEWRLINNFTTSLLVSNNYSDMLSAEILSKNAVMFELKMRFGPDNLGGLR